MEGGGDDEDDDESRCEYATLTCRRSAGAATTEVHVKVWFHDDAAAADRDGRTTVLRAHVAVADTGDAYSGRVTRREAAGETTDAAAAASVRRWLENARRALTGTVGCGGDDDDDDDRTEYVHCLEADADGGGVVAALAWKRKLRPFGAVALGSVRLCRDGGAVGPSLCRAFVGPLVGRLSAERLRAWRAERAAAEDARRLLADNARLLDALRSAADGRRLDDDRLTAQFVRVLNAKKARLAAVQRELDELKEQRRTRPDDGDEDEDPVPEEARAPRRGGRRGARGRGGKRGSVVAGVVPAKRGRRQTTAGVQRPSFGFAGGNGHDWPADDPKADDRTADDRTADDRTADDRTADDPKADDRTADDRTADDPKADDPKADDRKADVDLRGAADGRHQVTMMETDDPVSVPPDDPDVEAFEADTQIDVDDRSSSPSFFRQITSTTHLAVADEPPPDKDVGHQNKSFLDDLWHGIL